jgi:tRNA-dihydrouridine synthase B
MAQIPVIGNGDIKDINSFNEKIKSGVDGAMIGRGLLGRPWLIKECITQNQEKLSIGKIKETVLKHLDLTCNLYGEKAGAKIFRKHAAWYSFGMNGATEFRFAINNSDSKQDIKNLVNKFFI